MNSINFNFDQLLQRQEASKDCVNSLIRKISVLPGNDSYISPNVDDLAFITALIQIISPNRVVEYGCGYSSVCIASTLIDNLVNGEDKCIYQIFEAHQKYLDVASLRFDQLKLSHQNFSTIYTQSSIKLETLRADGSHRYDLDPLFMPEFIYLDGPDPADIDINCTLPDYQRPPISSDILRFESMLEPGTFLLIDGRALNQRYLSSRLKRNWKWFTHEDRHLAYIDEEPLGNRSRLRLLQRNLIK